jgi:hypothetical protein
VTKRSTIPGPRAASLAPAPRGEHYTYQGDKYWTVAELRDDGTMIVRTRRGKAHVVQQDDPNVRHATLAERLIKASRFPSLGEPEAG